MRHSPDVIHRARQDYAAGTMTVDEICIAHGMSRHALMRCVDGGAIGDLTLAPLPRRRGGGPRTGRRRRRLHGDRSAIVQRVWRTAEAQVRDIEHRLTQDQQPPDARERDARLLAILVKTLRELSTLDESHADGAATTNTAGDDDEVPRDIDEFRRALARRMDAFVERRLGTGVSGE